VQGARQEHLNPELRRQLHRWRLVLLVVKCSLYVYGGLQILKSTLSDFNRIRLNSNQEKFEWEQVEVRSQQDAPGPRAKHALVYCKERIYLVGGILSSIEISNDLHVYELASKRWTKLQPKGDPFPPI